MTACSVGIDLGTSSVKVVALGLDGGIVASAQVAYPILRPHPGWAEQNPETWWDATRRALRSVLAGEVKVVAVGVTGQMHGLVPVDRAGVPVRNAIIWSDARTQEQVEAWNDRLPPGRVEHLTGMPVATGMLGVSLTWLRDAEPEAYRRTAFALSPKDYVRFRLTGRIGTEPTDAAGGLLFDIGRAAPSAEIADAVGIDTDLLPPVGASLHAAGEVTAPAAAETGLPAGVPVAFGGGDQAVGAMALGLDDPARAAVGISSGGTLFARTRERIGPEHGLHVMPSVRPDEWMAMGVVLAAGLSIDWLLTRVFGRDPAPAEVSRAMAEAADIPAGADGLIASPHLGGTRTPTVSAESRAWFAGLGFDHGQGHLVRATVEGVCLSLGEALGALAAAGTAPQTLIMTGGGARFPVWRETLANATGRPVQVSSDLEHSALGAALAGAVAAGAPVAFDAGARVSLTVDPDPTLHERYLDLAERRRAIERAMSASAAPRRLARAAP